MSKTSDKTGGFNLLISKKENKRQHWNALAPQKQHSLTLGKR